VVVNSGKHVREKNRNMENSNKRAGNKMKTAAKEENREKVLIGVEVGGFWIFSWFPSGLPWYKWAGPVSGTTARPTKPKAQKRAKKNCIQKTP